MIKGLIYPWFLHKSTENIYWSSTIIKCRTRPVHMTQFIQISQPCNLAQHTIWSIMYLCNPNIVHYLTCPCSLFHFPGSSIFGEHFNYILIIANIVTIFKTIFSPKTNPTQAILWLLSILTQALSDNLLLFITPCMSLLCLELHTYTTNVYKKNLQTPLRKSRLNKLYGPPLCIFAGNQLKKLYSAFQIWLDQWKFKARLSVYEWFCYIPF